jgi:hypothetical protein
MTTTRTIEEIRPFSNGTQFMDWQSRNCCRCKKHELIDVEAGISTCEIAEAIADHACGDPLSGDMARRMGYLHPDGETNDHRYTWDCTERVIGKPGPKVTPPPLPVDQELRKLGMAVLPGFEGV